MNNYQKSGFTLVELSIVLVIIGLLVGGVLVGKDLIKSAEIRSQISQIEAFNTAANTFKIKYGYLPGDITSAAANSFGFDQRGSLRGQGDGNGVIEGNCKYNGINTTYCSNAYALSGYQGAGESGLFWVDLSDAQLISGNFSTASCCNFTYGIIDSTTTPSTKDFFPTAKLGNIFSIMVTNGHLVGNAASPYEGINFFTLAGISSIAYAEEIESSGPIPVNDAYLIDSKMDDGLPKSGKILALILQTSSPNNGYLKFNNSYSNTGCYDTTSTPQYSVGQANGACLGLSFKMQ